MQSDDEKNNWLFEKLTASPQIVPKDSIIKAVSLARSGLGRVGFRNDQSNS